MDVNSYLGKTEIPDTYPDIVGNLADRRQSTFLGFVAIESERGFIRTNVPLESPQGQETLRMLAYRTIEELGESLDSQEEAHRLEELIDAINYLWSMLLVKEDRFPRDFIEGLERVLRYHDLEWDQKHLTLGLEEYGSLALQLSCHLGDVLRNRPWMENAQSTYLDLDLPEFVLGLTGQILKFFGPLTLFVDYYNAKDEVLKFRLASRY